MAIHVNLGYRDFLIRGQLLTLEFLYHEYVKPGASLREFYRPTLTLETHSSAPYVTRGLHDGFRIGLSDAHRMGSGLE